MEGQGRPRREDQIGSLMLLEVLFLDTRDFRHRLRGSRYWHILPRRGRSGD